MWRAKFRVLKLFVEVKFQCKSGAFCHISQAISGTLRGASLEMKGDLARPTRCKTRVKPCSRSQNAVPLPAPDEEDNLKSSSLSLDLTKSRPRAGVLEIIYFVTSMIQAVVFTSLPMWPMGLLLAVEVILRLCARVSGLPEMKECASE